MTPRFGVFVRTLLVFSALLKNSQADNTATCGTSGLSTTTVTIQNGINCTFSNGSSVPENGVITGLTPGAKYNISCSNCSETGTTKPEKVQNFSVTTITTSSLHVTWNKPSGNSSFYRVYLTGGQNNSVDNVSETSKNLDGLTPGVKYTINVAAVADDGTTEGANTTETQYTKPEVVKNLSVTEITTSSINLNWTEPGGNRSFYIVQWRNGTTNSNTTVVEPKLNVTALTPGVHYTFTVIAVAGDNETKSETANTSHYTKPEVVQNLTVSDFTTSSISLNWIEPEGNRSFYRVQWTGGSMTNSTNVTVAFTNITGLTAGVQYEITVTAVAHDGYTEGQNKTISKYTKPGVIKNYTATTNTTSISLTWDAPQGEVLRYQVALSNGSVPQSANSTSALLSNLTPGTLYNITVTAIAGDNQTKGEPFTAVEITKPAEVKRLNATDVTTSSVSLSWNKPMGNVDLYKIRWDPGTECLNSSNEKFTIPNLTPGIQYNISVAAVAYSVEGKKTFTSTFTKPEVVTNLSVTSFTTSSINLNWTESVGNRSFYRVQWTGGSMTNSTNVTGTFTNITDLTAGVQYKITVTAVAHDGYTEGQSETISKYTKPEVVRNLSVTEITTSSINLNWTEPEGNRSFYIVQWRNGTTNSNTTGVEPKLNVTALTPGVRYTFTVIAVAGDNETKSEMEEISHYTKPEVVTNLSVTSFTTSSISLNWTESVGNRSFYRVQWTGGERTSSMNVSETFTNITGLTAGVQYEITVIAVAHDGYTEGQSETISKYTMPEVVKNLSVTEITTSSINLNWTEPGGNRSFYIVQWRNGTTNGNETVFEPKLNVTALTPGVHYTFTVIAVAGDNETKSEMANVSHYTKPEVVRDLTVAEITTSSINLNWTEPEGDRSFYRVQWTDGKTNSNTTVVEPKLNVTALTPGVRYGFTVIAVAGDNETKSEMEEISHYTKPEVVRNLTVSNFTTSSVSLKWTEPVGNSSFYIVQTTGRTTNRKDNVTDPKLSITELTPGVRYTFSVIAVAGDDKTIGEATTKSLYTKPEIVTNLSVTSFTTSSISLNWTESVGNRSFYRVQWTGGERTNSTNVSETFTNITDLTAGVQYEITVIAVAHDGYTEGQSKMISKYTMPEVVKNLSVTEITTSSINLNWNVPGGNRSFYIVQWRNGTTNGNETVFEPKLNVTELTPGVHYTFTVIAVAGDNETKSETANTSHYTKPKVVRDLTVAEITTSSINLNWTEPEGDRSFYRVQWTDGKTNSSKTVIEPKLNVTALTPGVRYGFTVIAVAGDNETKSEMANISHYTKPEVVRNLTVSNFTTSSVSLKWTEPVGNSSFYIVQTTGGTTNRKDNVTDPKLSVTKLTPGVRYTFSVIAVAGDNKTIGEATTKSLYTKPEVVTNLSVTSFTTSSISLNWTESVGNRSFYRVQWTGGERTSSMNVSETFTNITGLTAGVQYEITVIAVAHDGYTEGQSETISKYTMPEVVKNLSVTEITTSSINLNWTEPGGNRSFYIVQWRNGTTNGNETVFEPKLNVTALTPGVHYTFTVIAVAGDNETKSEMANVSHYTKPKVVRDLTVAEITTSSINLNWTEPEGDRSFYTVQWTDGKTNSSKTVIEPKLNVTALTPGVRYTFTVIAVAGDNETKSEMEEISHYTMPEVVRNLSVTEITTSSINLNWTVPGGNRSFYIVQWTDGKTNRSISVVEPKLNVTALTPGVRYAFTVIAVAGDNETKSETAAVSHYTRPEKPENIMAERGTNHLNISWTLPQGRADRYEVEITNANLTYSNSSTTNDNATDFTDLYPGRIFVIKVTAVAGSLNNTSDATSIATVPTPPGSVSFSKRTNSSLQLEWTTPKKMEGAPDISYYITYQREGGENKSQNSSGMNTELSELSSGTSYNISVCTVGPQNLKSTAVHVSNFTLPNPVLNVAASPSSTSSIKVTWSYPLEVKNYYLYVVEVYNLTKFVSAETVSTNSTVMTGLKPGRGYRVTVATKAAPGSDSTTKETFSYTMPNAVTNLTVNYRNTTSIQLTWHRQNDYEPSYSYLVAALLDNKVVHNDSTGNENYTFYNLKPGTQYQFIVTTVVEGVKSTEESLHNYTKPESVAHIVLLGTTTSMFVRWPNVSGLVSSYSVLLYRDMKQVDNSTNLSNTTQNHTFHNLTPGVVYRVEVVTKSGPLESSFSESNATFPNPPGPITVESQTVSSINFTWPRPENMNQIPHNFSVSTLSATKTTPDSWYLLDSVSSGTPYDISVVTVGVLGFESTAVTARNYTRPYNATNLSHRAVTTNNLTLAWDQEGERNYSYLVVVTNDSKAVVYNNVAPKNEINITGLPSGSLFNCTVTTRAEDGTEAQPATANCFTRPHAVTELKAETLSTTEIQLTWTKPSEYKSYYRYRVTTAGCASQDRTLEGNTSVLLSGLNPGTNCTFCVTVKAADFTTGKETCISQYTYPEAVKLNISSQGSNSSVVVSWTHPLGNVESYVVLLKTPNGKLSPRIKPNSSTSELFDQLSAGREYTAMITTVSGPFNATSKEVTDATYPNPPGPITIDMQTTSSIGFSWKEAPLMSGASFSYQMNIKPSLGGEITNITNSTNTSHTFTSLLSGTSYHISVATVGLRNYMSAGVNGSATTRPMSVRSLLTEADETSVNLSWREPCEYKESYRFNVTWISSEQIMNSTRTERLNQIISGLVPGTRYNFTVTTETSDGIRADTKTAFACTNASPVESLNCPTLDKDIAQIALNWSEPKGKSTDFEVTASAGNRNFSVIAPCCSHTFSNLSHFTEYNVTVVTQSCNASAPVIHNCRTGITNPSFPKGYERPVVKEKNYNNFILQINSEMLDNSNGPITAVGVLVTRETGEMSNLTKYLVNTYNQWKEGTTPVYLASFGNMTSISRSILSHFDIEIGNGSEWKSYFNGPLEHSKSYRAAIAVFTRLTYTSDGLVNIDRSFVSVTEFIDVGELPQDPVIIKIAIGATAGVFGFLFLILIGFIIYWRRISNKESSDIQIQSMRAKVSVAVTVEDFEAYYKKQKADSNCGFAEEFEDLKVVGTGQAKVYALDMENKPKNRYNNVLPYDSSRVKLSIVHGSPYDDYINANYMPGYNSRKEFIAAQGPLPSTVNDFWRMIWEKNVQTLVMLTRCNEQGRVKCEQYWSSGTKHCDDITVTTTSEIPLDDWTIRDFDIKYVKTAETRSVRHFHFTAWPDHGVPETTELLISFRHLVREHMNQYSRHSPTVVHCSAGVGRTGTFIAIDRLIFQIERENIVDVYGIVHDLRMHRPLMVQTEDQYVFLNQCALDVIRSRTGTNVDLIYQNAAALSIYENVEPKRGFNKNGYHQP
ncbi:receptor-type tyrosine-protein phosphatase beta isoform X4 [Mugil cephalus]|uniref:receptor-type tyrosine-protein phosphatase beta isoform X4 n=1 Tax=Mugil cephalus TaxID=48193 RepID=UPI001FB80832|nr:receptor-type tyrosine-protein phosphatase beta isoform X4 [Mugil cephalus]